MKGRGGRKRSTQRNRGPRGESQYMNSDHYYQYTVPIQNRFEQLAHHDRWDNQRSLRPFLGRGRSMTRGYQGNRIFRRGPTEPQSSHPPYHQGRWKPQREYQQQSRDPARKDPRDPVIKDVEDVGQVEGSNTSKKKEREGVEGIYNLSKVTLSHQEMNILNLGLKCAPKKKH